MNKGPQLEPPLHRSPELCHRVHGAQGRGLSGHHNQMAHDRGVRHRRTPQCRDRCQRSERGRETQDEEKEDRRRMRINGPPPTTNQSADRTTVITMIDTDKQKEYLMEDKEQNCPALPFSFFYTGLEEELPRDFTRVAFLGRCV